VKPLNPYHICLCAQARIGTALLQLWHPIFYQERDLDDTTRSTERFGPDHTTGKETSDLVKGATDSRTRQSRKQRPTVPTVHSGHRRLHVLRGTFRSPTTANPRRIRRRGRPRPYQYHDVDANVLHDPTDYPQWENVPCSTNLNGAASTQTKLYGRQRPGRSI